MTEKVSLAKVASAMVGYGDMLDDVLDREDWELEGNQMELWSLVDYCSECGTYQRKSDLAEDPDDSGAYVCKDELRQREPQRDLAERRDA
jgi:hypothetical protein